MSDTFKVRVVKHTRGWYVGRIGEEFTVTDPGDADVCYRLLDNNVYGNGFGFYKDDCVIVEDKMEYTVNGKTYRQLKNITVKALIKMDAPDGDIESILEDYNYTEPISLPYAVSYVPSYNEILVDQGFVEVVEKEYEVKVSDRYTIGDSELMLCGGLSSNKICLAVMRGSLVGRFWDGQVYPCQDLLKITVDEFKAVLGQHHCESWEKIYATRVPYKKK